VSLDSVELGFGLFSATRRGLHQPLDSRAGIHLLHRCLRTCDFGYWPGRGNKQLPHSGAAIIVDFLRAVEPHSRKHELWQRSCRREILKSDEARWSAPRSPNAASKIFAVPIKELAILCVRTRRNALILNFIVRLKLPFSGYIPKISSTVYSRQRREKLPDILQQELCVPADEKKHFHRSRHMRSGRGHLDSRAKSTPRP
jgi:hypothetical protein